jgi:hypothetical protein
MEHVPADGEVAHAGDRAMNLAHLEYRSVSRRTACIKRRVVDGFERVRQP